MHKYLFTAAYLASSAFPGGLAQIFNSESLLSQRSSSPLFGDVCKSLRQACLAKKLPVVLEKLCNDYCEKDIDTGDLKDILCRDIKKYLGDLGQCASEFKALIEKQCKDSCGCSKDEDCGENKVCEDRACKPKVCHHYRECNYQICRDNKCVPCKSNKDCDFRPGLECTKGKCLPMTIPPPGCTQNSHCRPGLVCKDGDCGKCSVDTDCGKNKFCSNAQECMPKPPTCGEAGFDWAEWRGPSSWSGVKSPPFSEYDPTVFKSQTPENTGRTNILLINNPREIYSQVMDINLASVIHQGFLLAPETGNYTFTFGQADDIVLVWLGRNAYSGWTRANADIERTYIPPPGDETQTTRHLDQGTYYPVRIAWGDKGGSTAMSVRIMAPNGTELTGRDGGYFRTEACDGSYDKFPAYGPGS